MNRFYLFSLSLMLVLVLYALPEYSWAPIPVGACCDGAVCELVTGGSSSCAFDYQGDGTSCDPNPCAGACCLANGSECVVEPEVDCTITSGEYLGDGTVCGGTALCPAIPDHLMCYQVHDESVKEDGHDIVVPQFLVDMNCVDLGATRMFCAPACKDLEVFSECIDDDSITNDFICYRFGQCEFAELSERPPDQFEEIFVGDQFSDRFVSDFDEHMLCLPAEKLPPPPTPSPTPTPTPTPTPIPVVGCNDLGESDGCCGPDSQCAEGKVLGCHEAGPLPFTVKCVKDHVPKNDCCVEPGTPLGTPCGCPTT